MIAVANLEQHMKGGKKRVYQSQIERLMQMSYQRLEKALSR
jgi:hypothetical protein